MNLLKERQLCIIILLCWLGWLRGLAYGQLAEVFTGSANFSNTQLACLANLAAFITFIFRDKLWFEERSKQPHVQSRLENIIFNWLRKRSEQPALKRGKPKMTGGLGRLTTCVEDLRSCHVVMLSKDWPTFSMTIFMTSMSRIYEVQWLFLKCLPLQSQEVTVTVEKCTENHGGGGGCGCVVFDTLEDITEMLARRMPRTLKLVPDSCLCILPSLNCLRNGCHGCNHGLLYVDENDRLTESDREVDSPAAAAVCEILDDLQSFDKAASCICIPVRSDNEDKWTNQLITFLKADDKEFRGAVIRKGRTDASSALENYKNRNHTGECDADEEYSIASIFILPPLIRAVIVGVLTFWLKVDGFSSTVFATRAVQNYITKQNNVVSPHLFLRRAVVKANANKTDVCQVLYFTHYLQRWALAFLYSFEEGIVTNSCIYPWIVLFATWKIHISTGRIVMIVVGIFIALVLDAFDLKLILQIRSSTTGFGRRINRIKTFLICLTMGLEILCIVACSAIAGRRRKGIEAFGGVIYTVLQYLVLLKYVVGFVLLYMHEDLFSRESPENGKRSWWYRSCGLYTQSSAFLLNAILAVVRAEWE